MISIALISLLTSVALAQNPLIPSGISTQCSGFLTSLNTDPTVAACIGPLVSATSAYGPTAQQSTKPTLASMTSALNTICAPSAISECPASLFRTKLAEFYSACTKELTSDRNDGVIIDYDILYALLPLREALCSKDDNGRYCVTETNRPADTQGPGPNGAVSNIALDGEPTISTEEVGDNMAIAGHAKRAPGDQVAFAPNATTMARTNLVFLFLNGDLPADKLCTTCTKNIVTAWINFESTVPYAPGLAQSALFPGQPDLYKGITATCGKSFLGGAVQAAGGIGNNGPLGGGDSSGAPRGASQLGFASVAAALAAIGFALAF